MQSYWLTLERELVVRSRVKHSLSDWAIQGLRAFGHRPAAHHRLLLAELACLAAGQFTKLMILMPPGSAKSTYASVVFPAWWFVQHPGSSVIFASHTQSLSEYFSRKVQDIVATNEHYLGYGLSPGACSAAHWRTSNGGEYFATSVRGSIVGRRADLAIVDDPIRSTAEANSSRLREHLWAWYRTELVTRLKPGARMAMIMTRWHDDDLCGRLLNHEIDEWRVVRLPALAEENDPLSRHAGEAIWPGWEDEVALATKRKAVGERMWQTMFQQRPHPQQGGLFNVDCLHVIDELPPMSQQRIVRAWDLAATAPNSVNNPDWTVGVKMARDAADRYIVVDVLRMQGSARQVEDMIVATAERDGREVCIGLPEDPGQAGKSQVAYLSGRLSGFVIVASRETGSKYTRAAPVSSQVEAGNVSILRGRWNAKFMEELRSFPLSEKDDQVDALTRAFETLTRRSTISQKISVRLLER